MNKNIVIFAGNGCIKKKENYYFSLAYKTGKLLAKAGYTVVTGGGPGLMNMASKGAYKSGGKTIGVCLEKQGRRQSKYLSEKLIFKKLKIRQEELLSLGDGFIALPGGVGTLYEIIEIMALKRKGEILPSKPLILVDSYYENIVSELKRMHREGFIENSLEDLFRFVSKPSLAIEILSKHFGTDL